MYENRTTQENQILDLLRERKGAGVYSYELAEPHPKGCGILQYNARIFGLRRKGHKIISDFKGHYILEDMNESKIDRREIEENLQRLREEWKTATTAHRKLIEIRAKILKKQLAENTAEPEATPEDAERIFREV